MGRLAEFRYDEVTRRLRRLEFVYYRQAHGSHEIWRNAQTRAKVSIPHHAKPLAKGTLRASLREGGVVTVDEFLDA